MKTIKCLTCENKIVIESDEETLKCLNCSKTYIVKKERNDAGDEDVKRMYNGAKSDFRGTIWLQLVARILTLASFCAMIFVPMIKHENTVSSIYSLSAENINSNLTQVIQNFILTIEQMLTGSLGSTSILKSFMWVACALYILIFLTGRIIEICQTITQMMFYQKSFILFFDNSLKHKYWKNKGIKAIIIRNYSLICVSLPIILITYSHELNDSGNMNSGNIFEQIIDTKAIYISSILLITAIVFFVKLRSARRKITDEISPYREELLD